MKEFKIENFVNSNACKALEIFKSLNGTLIERAVRKYAQHPSDVSETLLNVAFCVANQEDYIYDVICDDSPDWSHERLVDVRIYHIPTGRSWVERDIDYRYSEVQFRTVPDDAAMWNNGYSRAMFH